MTVSTCWTDWPDKRRGPGRDRSMMTSGCNHLDMTDMCQTCGQLTEPCECGRPKHLGAGHACTAAPGSLSLLPWRVGRKVGRTIYAQPGTEATDSDPLIGVLDTAELAEEACAAHNYRLALQRSAPAMHPAATGGPHA